MKIFISFFYFSMGAITMVNAQSGTMTDARDGKIYKTIKIGEQVWMAENLAYAPSITFTDKHREFKDNYYYKDSSYYFCFNDSIKNLQLFGALYPFTTAVNVCPTGWHLPNKTEFEKLFDVAGKDRKAKFDALIKEGSTGFNALLCGELYNYPELFPQFQHKGKYTFYWISTRQRAGLWAGGKKCVINTPTHTDAYSVRCVQN